MTEEEFTLKVKPHIDGLFTGKYDLIVTPEDKEQHPINYATIIRTLVSAVNSLLDPPTTVHSLETPKRRKLE